MKITRVRPLAVNGGYINWIFVKIETDVAGLVGWGESSLEWKTNAVLGAIKDLEPLLVGQDPTRIEHVWQTCYRGGFYRGGAIHLSAMSGIDQACWDILGKKLNQPVYKLLGGPVRDKVRLYGHMVGDGKKRKKPLSAPELAKASLVNGMQAIKCGPGGCSRMAEGLGRIRRVAKEIGDIRKAVGPDVELMVDLHGRCTPATSVQYGKALEDLGLLFLEEPCLPYSVPGMKHVADHVHIPIATGERLVSKHEFEPLLQARAAEVYQPDPSHCGGITETRKIAAMAEASYCSVAPHNPLGPINTQVCLHLGMALPNFLIQEVLQVRSHWRYDVATPRLTIVDGHAHPGNRPGLGIEVNERECAKHPYKDTRQPAAFHADGSLADW